MTLSDAIIKLSEASRAFATLAAGRQGGLPLLPSALLMKDALKPLGEIFGISKPKANESTKGQQGPNWEAIGDKIGVAAGDAIKKILEDHQGKANNGGFSPFGKGHPGGTHGMELDKDKIGESAEKPHADTPNTPRKRRFGKLGRAIRKARVALKRRGGRLGKKVAGMLNKPAATAAGRGAATKAATTAAAGGATTSAATTAATTATTTGGAATAARVGGVLGPVGMAAAAVALAMYSAAKAAKDMAYEQENYSRRLGEVNATIASQQAQLDANRVFRDMDTGDRVANSNQDLLDSIDRFETALKPLEEIVALIKNSVASGVLDVISSGVEVMGKSIIAIHDIFSSTNWADKIAKDPEMNTFGGFLDEINKEVDRERANAMRALDNAKKVNAGR